MVGGRLSYVDLSIFQVIAGLRYAFPRAMTRLEPKHPGLIEVHDRVLARPRIAAYLADPARRVPFSQEGIFRGLGAESQDHDARGPPDRPRLGQAPPPGMTVRSGLGFDLHPLVDGRPLVLGG